MDEVHGTWDLGRGYAYAQDGKFPHHEKPNLRNRLGFRV